MSKSLAAGLYPDATGTHQIFGNLRRDPQNVLAMARPARGHRRRARRRGKAARRRSVVVGAPVGARLCAAARRAGQRRAGRVRARRNAARQRRHRHQRRQRGAGDRPGRLRRQPQAARQRLAADRPPPARRALSRPRQRCLARPRSAGDGDAEPAQGRRPRAVGRRRLAPLARLELSRRRLRLHHAWSPSQRSDGEPTITFNLDTRRARTEVRAQQTQGTLVRELVAKASNDASRDAQIGRTLFDLLVPVELEPFLGGTGEMVIELDAGTAAIPWELLDTPSAQLGGGDPRPWSIRSKLLRKLRTAEFRSQVSDADADGSVLVIGAPLVDATLYPPLPGALAEAAAVVARLGARCAGLDAAHVRALRQRQRRCAQRHQCPVRAAVSRRPRRRPRRAGRQGRRRSLGQQLSRPGRSGGDAHRARARLPQLLPSRRARCAEHARALRPRRFRCQHRRGADRDRRALRRRRRLGRRGRAGRDLRHHLLRRAARRRPLHRGRRRSAQRRLARQPGRQYLGRLPVLRRPGLDLAARRRRCAARRRRARRGVRRRVLGAGAGARARDDLDPPALRRRRDAKRLAPAGAARQDPLSRIDASRRSGAAWVRWPKPSAWPSPTRARSTRRSSGIASPSPRPTAAPRSGRPSSSATSWRGAARRTPIRCKAATTSRRRSPT